MTYQWRPRPVIVYVLVSTQLSRRMQHDNVHRKVRKKRLTPCEHAFIQASSDLSVVN